MGERRSVAGPISAAASSSACCVEQVEARLAEGDQPLVPAHAPGPSGGLAADDRFLKDALALAEHRQRQRGARAEAAEQGALADARRLGDLVHRHAAAPRSANSRSAAARMRARLRVASARSSGASLQHRQLEHRQIGVRWHTHKCTRSE